MLLCILLPASTRAEEAASVRYAEIVASKEGYVANTNVNLPLNPRLMDAVSRGVALYFSAELTVERPRWYWLNEVIVERRLNYRLSYHAITRRYRLSSGNLHQSFDTLEAAVKTLSRIRNWHVVDQGRLQPGVSYRASMRMYLDTSLLPKPFQVTVLGNRDWHLDTDRVQWTFLAGAVQ